MLATLSVFFGAVGAASASDVSVTSGTTVGTTLTATNPTDANPSYTWFDCAADQTQVGSAIGTGPTYTLADSDVGNYVCVEDANDSNATAQTTATVTDNHESPPTISGAAEEGETLTAAPGGWGVSPTSIEYQWCRISSGTCSPISGANGSTYQLGAGDVGYDVEVQETPVDMNGPGPRSTMQQSADGDTVASAAPVRTSGPSITGADRQGQTLAVSVGTWTNDPAYSFQWLRCTIVCTAIPGAMGSTYALTDADVGTSLEVDVTGSNTYGSATATSSRTGIVSATTTTRLLTSSSTAHVNQPVTLTAFVYSSADTADPSGSMTFYDDGVAISGCVGVPVSGSGQGVTVSCSTSFGVSSPSLTAAFTPSPSSPLTASSSSAQTMSVLADGSTVTLDVPAQAVRHQPVTYTASVSPAGDLTGPIVPGGTVEFLDHGRRIKGCTRVPLRNGGATCTTRYSATGRERITVRYAGSVNFAGASSPVRTVRILRALPRRTVTATMQWTFHYTPAYTRILALVLHGVPAHSQVTVRCVGRGCPYHARTRSERRALQTLNLESGFRGRRLHVRAQVVVEVTRAQYVGKYYRFTILARRQPSIVISCLAPGSHRPGVGCRR